MIWAMLERRHSFCMDVFPDKENLDEVYENNDYDDEDDDHTFDVPR